MSSTVVGAVVLACAASLAAGVAPAAAQEAVAQSAERERPALLMPLYASYVTLQLLDVDSTTRALENGHRELNPIIRGWLRTPAGMVALKAASTAVTFAATERLRKSHPVAAVVVMAALNGAYVTVVARNYKLASRSR